MVHVHQLAAHPITAQPRSGPIARVEDRGIEVLDEGVAQKCATALCGDRITWQAAARVPSEVRAAFSG
jgi:hypothetical protein